MKRAIALAAMLVVAGSSGCGTPAPPTEELAKQRFEELIAGQPVKLVSFHTMNGVSGSKDGVSIYTTDYEAALEGMGDSVSVISLRTNSFSLSGGCRKGKRWDVNSKLSGPLVFHKTKGGWTL